MVAALCIFSVLMIAAGLFGLVAGLEIIRLEWGATFFASGVVSITGGFVTLGLAMVLAELKHIRRQGDAALDDAAPWRPGKETPAAIQTTDTTRSKDNPPADDVSESVSRDNDIPTQKAAAQDKSADRTPSSSIVGSAQDYPVEHDVTAPSSLRREDVALDENVRPQPNITVAEQASEATGEHREGEVGAEPEKPKPARSFSVGQTTYVVFTDGSIEARTPEGTRRFASMEDVRTFLATRD